MDGIRKLRRKRTTRRRSNTDAINECFGLQLNSDSDHRCVVVVPTSESKPLEKAKPGDCVAVVRTLGLRKADRKFIEAMNSVVSINSIPKAFSLDMEIERLSVVKRSIKILSHNICMSETEALASDLAKVGRDMHESVSKLQR